MACPIAEDKILFPYASDVVRVGTPRWEDHHAAILQALCQAVREFLRARAGLPFERLVDEYKRIEPRAKVGNQWAYLLYGDDDAFFCDGSAVKMNIKGLVFEKMKPRRKGRRGRGSKTFDRCVRV